MITDLRDQILIRLSNDCCNTLTSTKGPFQTERVIHVTFFMRKWRNW